MIDVREIKLSMRYPESRQEDITDAFMRGYTGAVEIGNKAIKKLEAENAKLRELVRDMWEGYNDPRCDECHLKDTPTCADCPICAREASVFDRLRELGVEVDG